MSNTYYDNYPYARADLCSWTEVTNTRVQQVLDAIENQTTGRLYAQDIWFATTLDDDGVGRLDCGTACCLAGEAAIAAGFVPVLLDEPPLSTGEEVELTHVIHHTELPRWRSGQWVETPACRQVAQSWLGLGPNAANTLFEGGNSLDLIWLIAYGLSGGVVSLPEWLVEGGARLLADIEERGGGEPLAQDVIADRARFRRRELAELGFLAELDSLAEGES